MIDGAANGFHGLRGALDTLRAAILEQALNAFFRVMNKEQKFGHAGMMQYPQQ